MKNRIRNLVGLLVIMAFAYDSSARESEKQYAPEVRAFEKKALEQSGVVQIAAVIGEPRELFERIEGQAVQTVFIENVPYYLIEGKTYIDASKLHDEVKKKARILNSMYFERPTDVGYVVVNRSALKEVPEEYAPLVALVIPNTEGGMRGIVYFQPQKLPYSHYK